ncbi:MAG: winged helix-turn-helix domain-containing protein [Candidatus Hermodarchaeota archaeon]
MTSEKVFQELTQKIVKRMDDLEKKMAYFQETILKTRIDDFGIVIKQQLELRCADFINQVAEEDLQLFLQSPACAKVDECSQGIKTQVEDILNAFQMGGIDKACQKLQEYEELTTRLMEIMQCPDERCFQRATKIIKDERNILGLSQNILGLSNLNFQSIKSALKTREIPENKLLKVLSPLANIQRLRILKSLRKYPKAFTELEKELNLKSGHLQFHLTSLLDSGYIIQQESRGKYHISSIGVNAIETLLDLYKLNQI